MTLEFTKQHRLLTPQDFKTVFDSAKRYHASGLTVLVRREAQDEQSPRLGLIISKKQVPHAVDRNRLKRLLRESFRQNQTILPQKDIVVLVKKSLNREENKTIFQGLKILWAKLR